MARQIELEITERTLVENLLFASGTMEKIKSAGMQVSLDDFGTGCCFFSYLSSMPLDAIKIDRSFIGSLEEPRQKILIVAMISFSDKLGMKVIAEGVETEEQMLWLKAQGCDVGQGYYFGKPVPFERLLASMQKN